MSKRAPWMLALAAVLFMAFPAWAQEEPAPEPSPISALDTVWVLVAGVLVFFMQSGFAMVEAGMVRAKNAANVLMKNLLDFAMASLAFWVFGFAIMFGGVGPIVGTSGWFMVGAESPAKNLPVEVFWLFQAFFAGTAATIVSGAVAERMRFVSYLAYSFAITGFVYPVVGHWVWGGGWLAGLGFHDFAGSTVVHALGGTAALMGAILLGPRIGRFNPDGSPRAISGHNLPLTTLGVFILWVGWYGFNPGSTLSLADPAQVGRIAVNTTLAGCAAALTAMLTTWAKFGKPDVPLTLNGALAGLVGITAGCSVVSDGSAIYIGAISGVLVIFGIDWLNKLRIDDPVGAVPVHMLCGMFGTLMVGVFGQKALGAPLDGLFYGGGFSQLGTQLLGVAACLGFTAVAMLVVFKTIDATLKLRVSKEHEIRGLDVTEHGVECYSGFQIFVTE